MSTKEILARYGHIVQGHVQSQRPEAGADAPAHSATNSQNSNSMATRIDIDANQTTALQKQSSARHHNQSTRVTPSNHDMGGPRPYAQDRTASPNMYEGHRADNVRSSYQAKPGMPGIAS